MKRATEIIATETRLTRDELDIWVREELVVATRDDADLVFTDSETARVRLICTLRYELEVEQETLPVVMSLLDQLYETRRRLRALGAAVAAQDASVREVILARLVPEDTDAR